MFTAKASTLPWPVIAAATEHKALLPVWLVSIIAENYAQVNSFWTPVRMQTVSMSPALPSSPDELHQPALGAQKSLRPEGRGRLLVDKYYRIGGTGADAETTAEAQVLIEGKRAVHYLPCTELASINTFTTVRTS